MKAVLMIAMATVVAFSLVAADASAKPAAAKGAKTAVKATQGGKAKAAVKSMSLADAKGHISEIIANPEKATEIMRALSNADQVAFLAALNAAINALPGSNEDKTAKFVNVDKAALAGAGEGNLTALVAEAFATIPAESLIVVQERFAVDLFNRDASAQEGNTYTDKQYLETAKTVIQGVADRVANIDVPAERITMAIMMFDRATNSSIPELVDNLIEMVPVAQRADAQNKWIPDAKEGNNETILEAADAGEPVNMSVTMNLAGPQLLEVMLGAIVEGTAIINTSIAVEAQTDESKREDVITPQPGEPDPGMEPGGYQGQTTF